MRLIWWARPLALAALLACAVALASCGDGRRTARAVPGADLAAGREAIARHGCVSCHAVPGVRGVGGVDSHVGPPLDGYGARRYIAGTVANTDANLIRWIQNPQAIRPGSAMPDLGVGETDARNIAGYLYSLP
ncbi:MAG TPA: c-type cytochrome [Chloroflexaceae bacterium]|mgnify:CR=1 FL=1|nr:c-type cytochrome [Chloroflexaceae bacterium]